MNRAYLRNATRFSNVCVRDVILAATISFPMPVLAWQSMVPSAAFVQAGTVRQTRELSAGLVWDWGRRWEVGLGEVTGYWEVSLSRWSYTGALSTGTGVLGQAGFVPVFRYRLDAGKSPWFVEGGVGATIMSTLYQTDRKRFSTRFNFGDHIALGRNFGSQGEHEISLRMEHFSNAGIKEPNPGENFVQLRYLFRFH